MTNYNAPNMISYVLYIFTLFLIRDPRDHFYLKVKIPGFTDYIFLKSHENKIEGIKLS